MTTANLEHVNLTVADPQKIAGILCRMFDWNIRWEGTAKDAGFTVHVGPENDYLALYRPPKMSGNSFSSYTSIKGLNHIGIVVDDIDAMEERVLNAGYKPKDHGDYEPGKRFYFNMEDALEIEIVSYSK